MYRIYRVMPNDTLNSIASILGIDIKSLIEINGFNENKILIPGEEIIIPNIDNRFNVYIVEKGDNLYSIASKYNTDYKTLLLLNGLNEDDYIYPNQELIIPNNNTRIYIVKENDTLDSIVRELNTDIDTLLKNKIYLLPDQILFLQK